MVRAALRVAIKERRDNPNVRDSGAPNPYGAPVSQTDAADCAKQTRRTHGAPDNETTNPQVSAGTDCAATERRTPGAPDTDAPPAGAPPLPPNREGRTGAFDKQLPATSAEPIVDTDALPAFYALFENRQGINACACGEHVPDQHKMCAPCAAALQVDVRGREVAP